LTGAFAAGGIGAGVYVEALETAVLSGDRFIEGLAFEALHDLRERVLPEADWSRVMARVAGRMRVDWALAGADAEQALCERQRASFLLETAGDAAATRRAVELGGRLMAGGSAPVGSSLAALVLGAAVRAGGAEAVRTVAAKLAVATDPDHRRRLLRALGQTEGEAAEAAREALLMDAVRGNELASTLGPMFDRAAERPAAWRWLQRRFDAVVAKVPEEHVGELPRFGSDFCSTEDAEALQTFFDPRAASLMGAPRSLAQAVEHVRLCAALRAHHREALKAALAR
jgi:alanyl aminopeptidase